MTRDEILKYYSANYHDYSKIKLMLNRIVDEHEEEIQTLHKKLNPSKEIKIQESKNELLQKQQTEIGRIVNLFDVKRKSIQANFVRVEYRNVDGEYLLRKHLHETQRTPQMFIDAIQWLFSKNPKAGFHREYIMNIGNLIKHFNTLEHQSMHSQESIQYSEEAQVWANVYKKKGFSDQVILEKLREGGYLE